LSARLAAYAAMIRIRQERFEDALRQGRAAAEEARDVGETAALAEALVAIGSARLSMASGGLEQMEEAMHLYQKLGNLPGEAMTRANLGVGCYIEGRWDEALSWYEGARATRLKVGNPVGAAASSSNAAELYVKQNRLDEAEPLLRQSIRVMRASGFHDEAAYAEIQLGRVLLGRGNAGAADELLGRIVAEFNALGQKSSVLEAIAVQALAKVRLGAPAESLRLIDEAAAAAGAVPELIRPQIAESRAIALAALGQREAAEQEVASALDVARSLKLSYEEGMLLQARIAIRREAGLAPDSSDIELSERILGALGVRPTPEAP